MFSELPVIVSPSVPPTTFSIVLADESVSVSPTFTIWAAAFDKSTATDRVVVLLKLTASVPPPASLIVSLPKARSVSNANVSLPMPPVSMLFCELPVSVSLSDPPIAFSIVVADESVSVSPAFTTWAAALERSTATARPDVVPKSTVSVPPPASLTVSLPRARSVSNAYVSLPAPPVSVLLSELPVSVSLSDPPTTLSTTVPADRVSVSPVFTIWAAALDRLTATFRVVVPLKSSVSIPPPASLTVSLPSVRSVSNR